MIFMTLVVVCDWSQYKSVARTCRTVVHIRGQGIFANICYCSMFHKKDWLNFVGPVAGKKVLTKLILHESENDSSDEKTGHCYVFPLHVPATYPLDWKERDFIAATCPCDRSPRLVLLCVTTFICLRTLYKKSLSFSIWFFKGNQWNHF